MVYYMLRGMHCKLLKCLVFSPYLFCIRLAYRAGVTTGIVAPSSWGFLSGLSTAFNTGVAHKLKKGAVVQDVTALHVAVGSATASTSTQIAALRRLLLGNGQGDLASQFSEVTQVCNKLYQPIKDKNADKLHRETCL